MYNRVLLSTVLVLMLGMLITPAHAQDVSSPFVGGLDVPRDGQVLDQGYRLVGWAADTRVPVGDGPGMDRVSIYIDRAAEDAPPTATANIEARPDVAAATG